MTSLPPPSRASPQPRRKTACQHCFKRKMKCDLVQPTCTNCQRYHQICIPVPRQSKPRPTNEKIDELEREIDRLRSFLDDLAVMEDEPGLREALQRWARDGEVSLGGDRGLTGGSERARERDRDRDRDRDRQQSRDQEGIGMEENGDLGVYDRGG
jgi:hypothetical protein